MYLGLRWARGGCCQNTCRKTWPTKFLAKTKTHSGAASCKLDVELPPAPNSSVLKCKRESVQLDRAPRGQGPSRLQLLQAAWFLLKGDGQNKATNQKTNTQQVLSSLARTFAGKMHGKTCAKQWKFHAHGSQCWFKANSCK